MPLFSVLPGVPREALVVARLKTTRRTDRTRNF